MKSVDVRGQKWIEEDVLALRTKQITSGWDLSIFMCFSLAPRSAYFENFTPHFPIEGATRNGTTFDESVSDRTQPIKLEVRACTASSRIKCAHYPSNMMKYFSMLHRGLINENGQIQTLKADLSSHVGQRLPNHVNHAIT